MRLTDFQKASIIETCKESFGVSSKVYLFGSRVDDSKRGGDIDLFVECEKPYNKLTNILRFSSLLQRKIGEQKIDIIVHTFGENDERPIVIEARATGVALD